MSTCAHAGYVIAHVLRSEGSLQKSLYSSTTWVLGNQAQTTRLGSKFVNSVGYLVWFCFESSLTPMNIATQNWGWSTVQGEKHCLRGEALFEGREEALSEGRTLSEGRSQLLLPGLHRYQVFLIFLTPFPPNSVFSLRAWSPKTTRMLCGEK